ncbi:unnamed protein product [Amoebophrya sp. A120]|nr:unnamed protein product [Amoebophrya sp. A120]|eukprot:GSA120T00005088001.1
MTTHPTRLRKTVYDTRGLRAARLPPPHPDDVARHDPTQTPNNRTRMEAMRKATLDLILGGPDGNSAHQLKTKTRTTSAGDGRMLDHGSLLGGRDHHHDEPGYFGGAGQNEEEDATEGAHNIRRNQPSVVEKIFLKHNYKAPPSKDPMNYTKKQLSGEQASHQHTHQQSTATVPPPTLLGISPDPTACAGAVPFLHSPSPAPGTSSDVSSCPSASPFVHEGHRALPCDSARSKYDSGDRNHDSCSFSVRSDTQSHTEVEEQEQDCRFDLRPLSSPVIEPAQSPEQRTSLRYSGSGSGTSATASRKSSAASCSSVAGATGATSSSGSTTSKHLTSARKASLQISSVIANVFKLELQKNANAAIGGGGVVPDPAAGSLSPSEEGEAELLHGSSYVRKPSFSSSARGHRGGRRVDSFGSSYEHGRPQSAGSAVVTGAVQERRGRKFSSSSSTTCQHTAFLTDEPDEEEADELHGSDQTRCPAEDPKNVLSSKLFRTGADILRQLEEEKAKGKAVEEISMLRNALARSEEETYLLKREAEAQRRNFVRFQSETQTDRADLEAEVKRLRDAREAVDEIRRKERKLLQDTEHRLQVASISVLDLQDQLSKRTEAERQAENQCRKVGADWEKKFDLETRKLQANHDKTVSELRQAHARDLAVAQEKAESLERELEAATVQLRRVESDAARLRAEKQALLEETDEQRMSPPAKATQEAGVQATCTSSLPSASSIPRDETGTAHEDSSAEDDEDRAATNADEHGPRKDDVVDQLQLAHLRSENEGLKQDLRRLRMQYEVLRETRDMEADEKMRAWHSTKTLLESKLNSLRHVTAEAAHEEAEARAATRQGQEGVNEITEEKTAVPPRQSAVLEPAPPAVPLEAACRGPPATSPKVGLEDAKRELYKKCSSDELLKNPEVGANAPLPPALSFLQRKKPSCEGKQDGHSREAEPSSREAGLAGEAESQQRATGEDIAPISTPKMKNMKAEHERQILELTKKNASEQHAAIHAALTRQKEVLVAEHTQVLVREREKIATEQAKIETLVAQLREENEKHQEQLRLEARQVIEEATENAKTEQARSIEIARAETRRICHDEIFQLRDALRKTELQKQRLLDEASEQHELTKVCEQELRAQKEEEITELRTKSDHDQLHGEVQRQTNLMTELSAKFQAEKKDIEEKHQRELKRMEHLILYTH